MMRLSVLPPLPRPYFLSAVGGTGGQRWRQLALHIAGGMVPVARSGHLNRGGLELALAPFGPVRWFRPGHGWFNRRKLDQIH